MWIWILRLAVGLLVLIGIACVLIVAVGGAITYAQMKAEDASPTDDLI